MKYLKIENPGIAPQECFTLLGVSTSRGNADAIGQYGSGVKHAINMFLALGHKFFIYCGHQCLDFSVYQSIIDDGIEQRRILPVQVEISQSGKSTKKKDVGWTLDFGSMDWRDLSMACREFVSNAIDRCVKENKMDELDICVVEENQVRAKANTTRIFLPLTDDVRKFYDEIHKRFICLNGKAETGVLNKTFRNLTGMGAMVYRKGVLVKETTGLASLFDYNIPNLYIDECRNSNDHDIGVSVVFNIVTNSSHSQKVQILHHMFNTNAAEVWEDTFSSFAWSSCKNSIKDAELEKVKNNWKEAWKVIPKNLLLTDRAISPAVLAQKNVTQVVCRSPLWYRVWRELGLPVADNFLTQDERKGITYSEPNETTLRCTMEVYNFLVTKYPYLSGKPVPKVVIFEQLDETRLGYYVMGEDRIHINKSMEVSGDANRNLKSVVLEEITHYLTGYDDMTRELQTFLFNMVADHIS
jgi:hypothetical protein